MSDVNVHDLEAVSDVAARLAEMADSLSAEQAITLLHSAERAMLALKIAVDMLEAQALGRLEQPIVVGHTAYSKKPSFKKRPDQRLIQRVVVEKASHPDVNGEVPTAFEAADAATKMMAELYVSPSTLPKVGGVQALGIEMQDVTAEEHTGFMLKQTEID